MKKATALTLLLLLALMTAVVIPAAAQDDSGEDATEDLPTLRIAVLPVLNTLPLYVAQAEDFYADAGVQVELVPFTSARDQQVALQVGEVDGANTDMAVLTNLVNGGVGLKAIRHEPILEPFFAIVAGAESGVETVEDLAGMPIAIAENTIIEYLTTTMLTGAGLDEADIVYEEVPAIPVRLELLNLGQVPAATLPEPLTTLATQLQGSTLVISDATVDFVPTVLAISDAVIAEQPEAVRAFLTAYERAVALINADGEAYRDVMVGNINIPEPLRPTYPVPTFPTAQVPTAEETALVVDWMVGQGLLEEPFAYADLVDGSFLPLPTVTEIAISSPDFSTLVAALVGTGLVDVLNEPGSEWTVFAPTDAAFEGVDVAALDAETLTNVLLYHVIPDEITAADLIELGSGEVETASGDVLTFEVVDGAVVLNGSVTVATADIDAADGVIHIIDGVLLPGE